MEADPAAAAVEEDNSDNIERVLSDRLGRPNATGASTTVYAVEDNGDPNADFDPSREDVKPERQFLIKWKGWSHLHNTWESEHSMQSQNVKGVKKIENYKKRVDEVKDWLRQANPEDVEYYNCQNQLSQDLDTSFQLCDRIIAESPRPGHEYPDYLVKWRNLPYSDCTWEDGSLVARRYEHMIEAFINREQSTHTPTKLNPVLRKRPKFVSIVEQPSFFSGRSGELVLRDYQLDGINWMVHSWCRDNSVILADEMGLGKTIQTSCFIYYLFKQHGLYGPYLIVVPLSTLPAWQRELALWAPDMNVVTYLGDFRSRETIRHYEWAFPGNKRLKFNVLLTSYEILLKDKTFLGAITWAALLVDEAHRLKNEESLLYRIMIDFNTNYRLLITGTPLQNSLRELWSLLHFIMPHKFDKWENFDVEQEQSSKGYTRLHRLLEPFLLRRVKKDVEKSLPAKVEQILRVGMASQQKQFYKWILTRNYTMLKKGLKAAAPSLVNLIMELKKCCNHGFLIKPPDPDVVLSNTELLQGMLKNSGKLLLLDKLLVRLRERGHRVLIFSQMVRMLDILADYMRLRLFPFQRLDGSVKGEVRRQALDHFNAEGSQDFCFLLSTRAGGLGINLATADTVVIYDSDWNPQNDLQAQSRAHRIGQKNQVNIYRLVTMQSIEEDIVERAKRKMVLDHLVIQSMDSTGRTVLKKGGSSSTTPFNKEELNAILKFGAEELFNKDEVEDEEPTCDIDLILQRAETREDEPVNAPANDLLSAFKVASFHVDEDEVVTGSPVPDPASDASKNWEEIIPADLRAKVEQEEKQREMEDLYLPPRSRKQAQSNSTDASVTEDGTKRKRRVEKSSDEDSDDAEKNKKRSAGKDRVKGFTDAEVRRFFKAFRRFGCPLERLEAIATEAELQEKSLSAMRSLAETILTRCRQCMDQPPSNAENGHNVGNKKKERGGASFRLSGVAVYARPVLQALEDLEPLHISLPSNPVERQTWQLPGSVSLKEVSWSVAWGVDEDSRLLRGVYEYGMGAWESIKLDPVLHLQDKVLLSAADSKPQAKHLQARVEYLLKVLKKMRKREGEDVSADLNNSAAASVNSSQTSSAKRTKRAGGGRASKKAVSREIIECDDPSSEENGTADNATEAPEPVSATNNSNKSRPAAKKKSDKAPMHYTACHEPVQVNASEELPEDVFLQCKEKMRPVKKSLKALDSADPSLSELEQLNHTRQCLLRIGAHIDLCLLQLHQPDQIKEWRSNLWSFVSKFTEFDQRKLYKLYKHALKKQQGSGTAAAEARVSPARGTETRTEAPPAQSARDHKKHKGGGGDVARRKGDGVDTSQHNTETTKRPRSSEYPKHHNRKRDKRDTAGEDRRHESDGKWQEKRPFNRDVPPHPAYMRDGGHHTAPAVNQHRDSDRPREYRSEAHSGHWRVGGSHHPPASWHSRGDGGDWRRGSDDARHRYRSHDRWSPAPSCGP